MYYLFQIRFHNAQLCSVGAVSSKSPVTNGDGYGHNGHCFHFSEAVTDDCPNNLYMYLICISTLSLSPPCYIQK